MKSSLSNKPFEAILIFLVILSGIILRMNSLIFDDFNYDNLALMYGVEKSFGDYRELQGSFGIGHLIFHWISAKLFSNNLISFHVLPVLFSTMALFAAYLTLKKYWPDSFITIFIGTTLITLNSYATWTSMYIPLQAFSFLLGICIFIFFLQESLEKRISKLSIFWIPLFIAIAYVSKVTILIPIASGGLSYIIWNLYESKSKQWIKETLLAIKKFFPLIVFPITYIVIFSLATSINLGKENRPDMAGYFFSTSTHPQNLFGLLNYLLQNTYTLFASQFINRNFIHQIDSKLICFFALIPLLVTYIFSILGKADNATKFTCIYLTINYFVILIGGVLSIFPFGTSRYADFLLLPLIFLLSRGMHFILSTVLKSDRSAPTLIIKTLAIIATTLCLILAIGFTTYSVGQYKTNQNTINYLKQIDGLSTFITRERSSFTRALAPEIDKKATTLKNWGKRWQKSSKEGLENQEIISQSSTDELYFIVQNEYIFNSDHKEIHAYLHENYKLHEKFSGTNIAVYHFKK